MDQDHLPICQAEIDRLFASDKRWLVVKLRDLKLVEEFAGADTEDLHYMAAYLRKPCPWWSKENIGRACD